MPFYKCFPCLKFHNAEVVTKLEFSNTALTDIFPDVWQHERTLEELILTSSRINTLPPQLFYCQSLRILAVNNNGLEAIPNAIGSLRQLQYLNLSRNLISNVPENIKTCKNLTHLDLSCNHLQRLPDAITCLISLQELLLNETYLEFLPANFGRLVNLQILELRLNNLITLPKSMARLSNLQRIDIGGNEFTELPEVIGELKKLRELWIDFNQIRRISPNIANLRELQHFEANGNLIESLPNEISHWRNVQVLSVCTNNLKGLPFSIGMMKSLVTFKCESNQLRELPDSICNLDNLEELVISHNKLLRLPTTIGMLRKLRYIFVDDNELRNLPEEICNCSNLSVLSVSRNNITELPQNIGHLIRLKVLNIVNNFISTLPVSTLSLINLTSLWISDNQSQPLVPLQYSDANTKTQLTCFMLPQTSIKLKQQQYNENNSKFTEITNTEITSVSQNHRHNQQHLYEIQENYNTSRIVCTSPLRRICFAEEATIMTSAPESTPKSVGNNIISMEEPLATRLMRSPTPYPKELRLMAKNVRNIQKPTKNPELPHVKEARVMYNAYCDTKNEVPKEKELQVGSVINENSFIVSSFRNEATYSNLSLSSNSYNPHTQSLCSVMPHVLNSQIDNQNSVPELYASYCTNSLRSNIYETSMQLPQFVDNSQQKSNETYSSKCDMHITNISEPPPYHIARVFTKKSPQDLTNYDTIRNQQNCNYDLCQTQHQLQKNSYNRINDENLLLMPTLHDTKIDEVKLTLDKTDILNSFSLSNQVNGNSSCSSNCDQENNIAGCLSNLANHSTVENSLNFNVVSGHTSSDQSFEMEYHKHNGLSNLQGGVYAGLYSNRKTPWLFGVHKNPTVKQVTIRWEHHVGFEIEKLNNVEGIFVSATVPNTSAASLLCVHDKLLEVDGLDFTNISITEAKKVISNANAVMNIMLSRK